MGKETITLDNFADFHGMVKGVEIRGNLPLEPYIPSSEINIHMGRIARAASFGHIDAVDFSRYTKPPEEVAPTISGVDDQGTATASAEASVTKQARAGHSVDMPRLIDLWGGNIASIKLNFGHGDLDDIRLREARPWAKYLDAAMSEGLRGAGNKKLSSDQASRAMLFTGGVLYPGVLAALGHTDVAAFNYVGGLAFYNLLLVGLGVTGMNYFSRKEEWGIKYKGEYSLTPGIPFDRLALVQAYTRTRKFAEAK